MTMLTNGVSCVVRMEETDPPQKRAYLALCCFLSSQNRPLFTADVEMTAFSDLAASHSWAAGDSVER